MKKVNSVIAKVVAVLVWCVVAVGCVAEEPQSTASTADINVEQVQPQGSDSDVTIIDQVDPGTGNRYQEIRASFKLDNIQIDQRSSLRKTFLINNKIFIHQIVGGPKKDYLYYGDVEYPADYNYKDTKSLVGRTANIYCRLGNANEYYKAEYYCSLSGDNKYFLKIH